MYEARVVVSGKVQGVWFRASTQEVAREAGTRGFVKNLPDGRVEAVIQGGTLEIEKVIAFMGKGPPGALVTNIDVTWREPEKSFDQFNISG